MKNNLIISKRHEYNAETRKVIYVDSKEEKCYDSYDVKLDIFECRSQDWFLSIGLQLCGESISEGDYVAFMIGLAYFESISQFKNGSDSVGSSYSCFKESFLECFPGAQSDVIDLLWKSARCGLFHSGFTKSGIYISNEINCPIEFRGNEVYVNVNLFLHEISRHFNAYMMDLRNSENHVLGIKFQKFWDSLWGD